MAGLVEGGCRSGLGGQYAGRRCGDGHPGIQDQWGAKRGGGGCTDLGGKAGQAGGCQQAAIRGGNQAAPLLIAHCGIQIRSRANA